MGLHILYMGLLMNLYFGPWLKIIVKYCKYAPLSNTQQLPEDCGRAALHDAIVAVLSILQPRFHDIRGHASDLQAQTSLFPGADSWTS